MDSGPLKWFDRLTMSGPLTRPLIFTVSELIARPLTPASSMGQAMGGLIARPLTLSVSKGVSGLRPQQPYSSRTCTSWFTSSGPDTLCRRPDGHSTSMLSTVSASPSPKYSGSRLCDR